MKQIALTLIVSLMAATSAAAMQSKSDSATQIVHSDRGEIRISPNNDSR